LSNSNNIIFKYRKEKNKNEIKHYKLYIILILSSLIIISFIIGFYFGKKNQIKETYFSNNLYDFTSYSQFLEDLILYSVFYDVQNGFYIDIGANDPNAISVTKNLYIRGWYGINIEPLPDKFQELVKFRKRDINLQIGAGKMNGNATLYVLGYGSTLQKKENVTSIKIEVDTMSNICRKYVPKNEIIQFCKIDVEGGEKDVLLGYDFENYRPKVFCIESTLPDTGIPSYNLWEDILLKNDYSFAYQYSINRYYIDNRIKDLRKRFFQAEKSVDIYNKLNKKI
jgi:FkbM family methyltransferase